MNSNIESARLIARDARKWVGKRIESTRDGPKREDFRVSPYEK